jgi:hypothetical protein
MMEPAQDRLFTRTVDLVRKGLGIRELVVHQSYFSNERIWEGADPRRGRKAETPISARPTREAFTENAAGVRPIVNPETITNRFRQPPEEVRRRASG